MSFKMLFLWLVCVQSICVVVLHASEHSGSREPQTVVALSYDMIAPDKPDTGTAVVSAVACVTTHAREFGRFLTFLPRIQSLAVQANEFAKTTPGYGNIIQKLVQPESIDQNCLRALIKCVVAPTLAPQAKGVLASLKERGVPCIGFGNQDSLHHERYLQCLKERFQFDPSCFSSQVTVADYGSLKSDDLPSFYEKSADGYAAYRAYPSLAFAKALIGAAKNVAPENRLVVLDADSDAVSKLNQLRLPGLEARHCHDLTDVLAIANVLPHR